MKILIPVDSSKAPLAPIAQLAALHRAGADIEALVLNVQPLFSRHVSQFTSRQARDAWRAERGREATARAVQELAAARVPYRVITEAGRRDECIAAVAKREGVVLTVINERRPGPIERYALPAGLVGLTALLLTAE